MCGIGGIINFKSFNSEVDSELIFSKHLGNRGPDNFSTYENESFFLAHARLKIIELSDSSNQPMTSVSGNSIIVFNGEIYNFKEISKSLSLNIEYKSDTRVVLEAIEEWGVEKTLSKLKGMFAFCFVDVINKKSFLARDRFGQKPLYIYHQKKEFIFSSDIRVISELKKNNLTINKQSIEYYLCELSMPQPFTIWDEVTQLEPAHFIEVNFEGEIINKKEYWSLVTAELIEANEVEIIKKLELKLKEAILSRTVSDVPLACFLSGGVDSGLIVSILAKNSNKQIKTFTVGFDYDDFNELDDARIIAEKYNTDHMEVKININIERDIEDILAHFGEPFADSSAIPTYYISQEIKKHVTVALSGDGGDEFFGGYIDYGFANDAEIFQRKHKYELKQKLVGEFSKVTSRFLKNSQNYGTELKYLSIREPYKLSRKMGFCPINKNYLINSTGDIEEYFNTIWNNASDSSMTTNLMKASLKTRLLNDYLVKVDRASMANSLEVRSPFLDHELAEFSFSIPNSLKFKDGESKYLLKKLGEKYMYSDIFSKKKRGFGVPIKHWLKNELFVFADQHIKALVNRKFIVNTSVLSLLQEHKNGISDHTHRIWALVCLEVWLKNNI